MCRCQIQGPLAQWESAQSWLLLLGCGMPLSTAGSPRTLQEMSIVLPARRDQTVGCGRSDLGIGTVMVIAPGLRNAALHGRLAAHSPGDEYSASRTPGPNGWMRKIRSGL